MDDQLSDAEWLELECRVEFSVNRGDDQLRQLLGAFMDAHGRIPTPADDGMSGWFARDVWPGDDESLVQTRFAATTALWRWILTKLREAQDGIDETGGRS
jgi:hypothetical protein